MNRSSTAVFALAAVAVLTAAVLPGAVLASHDPDNTDYTVDPSNPNPGASGVTYVHEVQLTDNVDQTNSGFGNVKSATFTVSAAGVGNCSTGTVPDPTTTINLSVTEGGAQKEFDEYEGSYSGGTADYDVPSSNHDYLVGETLRLELGGCVTNPDTAGWYQADVTVKGKAFSGDESLTLDASSHYFYICDCGNEQEARDQLGPPPSEQTPTPEDTPTPTPTPTPTEEPTPTPTEPPDDDPTPTPTEPPDDDPTPTPTEPPDEGDDRTPTRTQAVTETDTGGEFFGMDPMLVVGIVAAISIGLAAFGATRL